MAFKGGKKLIPRSPSPAPLSSKKSSTVHSTTSPNLKPCTGVGLANGSSPHKGESNLNSNSNADSNNNKKKENCRYESMHPNNISTARALKKKTPEKISRDFSHRGRTYDENGDSGLSKVEEVQEGSAKKVGKGTYKQSSLSSDSATVQVFFSFCAFGKYMFIEGIYSV
eukprot:Gb_28639 [translate_table: standard]